MLDIRQTLLAQYANSPALIGILERFNAAVEPRRLIDLFLQDVWNPQTATGWGLDVWGRIVGVPRYLHIIPQDYWGFQEASDLYGTSRPFNDGIFYTEGALNARYRLPDKTYRRLIFAKAAANITINIFSALKDGDFRRRKFALRHPPNGRLHARSVPPV